MRGVFYIPGNPGCYKTASFTTSLQAVITDRNKELQAVWDEKLVKNQTTREAKSPFGRN